MTFKRPSCATYVIVVAALALVIIGLIAWYVYWLSTELGGPFDEPTAGYSYFRGDRTPRWSPDGRYLVADVGKTLYRVDLTSGVAHLIPGKKNREQYSPALSPDGKIAYVEYDPNPNRGGGRIVLSDIDGSRRRVVADWRYVSPVEWSPDGSRLLYLRGTGMGAESVLYSPDDPEITWSVRTIGDTSAAWSPDSQKIAFYWGSRFLSEDPYIIYVVNRDGASETVIDEEFDESRVIRPEQGRPYFNSESRISAPGWTTGGQLYYVKREITAGKWQNILYSVSSDGRERRRLANLSKIADALERFDEDTVALHEVRRVKPSQNGDRVLLFGSDLSTNFKGEISYGAERLYVLSLHDQSLREIPTANSFNGKPFASWSPDGKQIAVCDTARGSLLLASADSSSVRVLLTEQADPAR